MAYVPPQSTLVKPRIGGLFLMPLRLICAWIMFAAAWRRLVLKPESLDPSSPLYEGMKLNHFLPDAVLTGGILKYVIIHPAVTQAFLYLFTGIELTLGLLLFIGLATRVVGLLMLFLFVNLMLTVGWLGTTCLDEWTVAAFGVGLAVCLCLAGSGPYSVDTFIYNRCPWFANHKYFRWMITPELGFIMKYEYAKKISIIATIVTFAFVLGMNQYFVGGVWGPFHNPAIKPNLRLHASLYGGVLDIHMYRNRGPDTYGAFITDISLQNANHRVLVHYGSVELGRLKEGQIHNYYLVKVHAGNKALVVPLGALANIKLPVPKALPRNQAYTLVVNDVSGLSWQAPVVVSNKATEYDAVQNLVVKLDS